MEKYTFNKDYETQVKTASLEGTGSGTRQIKIAKYTIVEGEVLSKGLVNINYEGLGLSVDSSYLDLLTRKDPINPSKGADKIVLTINPKPSINKSSNTIFTVKNITLTLVVLGVAYGVLKYKKLI